MWLTWALLSFPMGDYSPGPLMNEWPWCIRPGLQYASLLTSSWLFYQQPQLMKKSSCNCFILTQSMPLLPIPAGLDWGMKELPRSEEKYTNLICFILYSFPICRLLRKSILQEVTNGESKCSWPGVQAHTYGKWRKLSKHRALLIFRLLGTKGNILL